MLEARKKWLKDIKENLPCFCDNCARRSKAQVSALDNDLDDSDNDSDNETSNEGIFF